jgi:Ca2+/H+ antiporter
MGAKLELVNMKKKILLIIAVSMLIFGVAFFIYAINHPTLSFPWNNTITYSIYFIYFVCMIFCFIASKRINK